MSDSRSSLDLLANPKASHPLSKAIQESIGKMRKEGRVIRLFWLRAHVGTSGNERADELAKAAALRETATLDYDKIPMSYVKKKIREETVRIWQDRYETSTTGQVTKIFLPDVAKAYRIVRKTKLTPTQVQVLTGHGGIAEYLHRFKLKDTPGCECDPNVSESVWHVILECPRYQAARLDLEFRINTNLDKSDLHQIIEDEDKRPKFLAFVESIFRAAAKRNATNHPFPRQQQTVAEFAEVSVKEKSIPANKAEHQLFACAERGNPGLRIRGVALFMDNNTERFGLSFCLTTGRNYVKISPGLASLLNGSTLKTSMKRKTFEALVEIEVAKQRCRIVRSKNKTILLFTWSEEKTPFAQACSLLTRLGEEETAVIPRIISVDAMVVLYEKGEVMDHLGCIKASNKHEIVVYEDRGENLSFLKHHDSTKATQHLVANPETLSGSERLQLKTAKEKAAAREKLSKRLG